MTTLSASDLRDLAAAKRLLEETSLSQRAIDLLGRPIEWGMQRLPDAARRVVTAASRTALEKAADLACGSLAQESAAVCRPGLHKAAAICAGAAGGLFGLPGLAVELPLSTTIMLRSIAQIGRSHGENLADPDSRLACLQVFALGGRSPDDDAMDSAYLAMRLVLAHETRAATSWLLSGGAQAARSQAPMLVSLVQKIAARFSIAVEQKLIAEALPVIGALGGGAVNGLFIDFFQDKAAGHFAYRRLERVHGPGAVREAYERL